MNQLTEFQAKAVTIAFKKLFTQDWFDISSFNDIAKMLEVKENLTGKNYEAMRTLHCIHYSEMGPQMKNQLREICIDLLDLPNSIVDVEVVEVINKESKESKASKPSWLRRLMLSND